MKYAIFNVKTGEQYMPISRTHKDFLYPNEYAAKQAIDSMPANWRSQYEVRATNTKGTCEFCGQFCGQGWENVNDELMCECEEGRSARLAALTYSTGQRPRSFCVTTSDKVSSGVEYVRFATAKDAVRAADLVNEQFDGACAKEEISLDRPTPARAREWFSSGW